VKAKNIAKIIFVFLTIFLWIFPGFPSRWVPRHCWTSNGVNKIRIPPEVQEA